MRVAAERILIVLLGAIGDVTRALPLAMRVRAAYPQARIAWAVEPAAAPLLEEHPALDERLVFARAGGAATFLRFLRRVRAGGFDLVLDLQRHLKSGLVSAASRAPVRIGFHRRNAKELNWLFNTHTIEPVDERGWKLEQYARFGDLLELPAAPPRGRAASGFRRASPPSPTRSMGSTWTRSSSAGPTRGRSALRPQPSRAGRRST